MSITQSAWTEKTANRQYVATCTVLADSSLRDSYTLKTPAGLDPKKPFYVNLAFSGTPDGQALPVDIWVGWDDNFALSGDNPTTATGGALFKQILDDCVLAVSGKSYTFMIDPNSPVADVVTAVADATGLKVRVPSAPYYAFALNGGSTLAAVTATWTIFQAAN